ncbi:unnamed protein product [Danaus chrysippus]|uniref:(African queen) hypothetical protein n=1 Tax=Danaus chrysippus TaxID=151541 RepID=A0A8J2QYK1_9NEOP|nr:unnamed protein product [Danaus chrysippus]
MAPMGRRLQKEKNLSSDPLGQQSIAASVTRPQVVKIKTSRSQIPVPIARARKGKSLKTQNENITKAYGAETSKREELIK